MFLSFLNMFVSLHFVARCFEKAVSLNDKHCYIIEKVLPTDLVYDIIITS